MKPTFKKNLNYVLDLFLAISGLMSIASGYVLWFLIPRGIGLHGESDHCSGDGIGSVGNTIEVLGMCRFEWITLHNWLSVALFVIIVLHIIIHWKYVVETTRRFKRFITSQINKASVVYWTVVLLSILFLLDSISGLVIWLVLPRGARDFNAVRSGIGREFLGLQRDVWVDLHAWFAVGILALLVIHLVVNWNWVVSVTKNLFRIKKSSI